MRMCYHKLLLATTELLKQYNNHVKYGHCTRMECSVCGGVCLIKPRYFNYYGKPRFKTLRPIKL